MTAQKRKTPARSRQSGGGRVSASANVAGGWFSGWFSGFSLIRIGGGGGRGRGRRGGGLLRRVARSAATTYREATGAGKARGGGRPAAGRARPGRTFAEFQAERADLFPVEDPDLSRPVFDITVDTEDDDGEEGS